MLFIIHDNCSQLTNKINKKSHLIELLFMFYHTDFVEINRICANIRMNRFIKQSYSVKDLNINILAKRN